jgi:hypothetical protein
MTIALGVLSKDGVVLAADTEENSGAFKTLQSKIFSAIYTNGREPVFSHSACGISGAGSAAHIDLLSEEWMNVFLNNAVPVNNQPRAALAEHLKAFYTTHLLPFVNESDDRRPEIEMIFALSAGPVNYLMVSQRTTLRPGGGFVAVGMGAGVATMLLKRLWHPRLDLKAAILLASYVVWFVKETVPFCGKATEILVLAGGKGSYVPWADAHGLESTFQELADLEAHVVRYVVGAASKGDVILPTADELKASCGERLHKLLPVVTSLVGGDGVVANNWRHDFKRRSGPDGDVPKLPIKVKRVRPKTKRDRKGQPPSPE